MRRPADEDEARFIADQMAEIRDALGAGNRDRAASLIVALEAEAPDSEVFLELLKLAGEQLAREASTGDALAMARLEEFLRIVAGAFQGGRQ